MGLYYTFGQLKQAVEHALGGVPDSRISSGLIVNRAINHLCTAHSWTWREAAATLDFVEGQGDIPLPDDFGELITEPIGNAAKYTTIRRLTAREIMILRVHGATDSLFLGYVVAAGEQTDATAPPKYVLRVAPVPASNLEDALLIHYRKIIPVYAATGTEDDDKVPAIPAGHHDTLYQLCRAFAVSMEEDPENAEWNLAASMLQRDIEHDGKATSPILGPMRHTGADEWMDDVTLVPPHTHIDFDSLP